MMYRCKYCHETYDLEDYTDEDEALTNCCPDCYYTGNMYSVEDDDFTDADEMKDYQMDKQ